MFLNGKQFLLHMWHPSCYYSWQLVNSHKWEKDMNVITTKAMWLQQRQCDYDKANAITTKGMCYALHCIFFIMKRGELRCFGRVSSFCSTCGTRRATIVAKFVNSHQWEKDRNGTTTKWMWWRQRICDYAQKRCDYD